MARWHEDDLAGRLLRGGGDWQNLRLPILAEPGDVLGRIEGEPLWPAWQDEAAISRQRAEVGERAFAALYQQNPKPPEAALFNTKTVMIVPDIPALKRTVRAWDLAATLPGAGRNPDYTVGVKLGAARDEFYIVLDVVRFQASPAGVIARIKEAAKMDGSATLIALPQDPGQAGVAQVAGMTAELVGYRVAATIESGPKITRAMPAATLMDGGKIRLLAGPWNENFLRELEAFPESQKDDQVDALSRAVNTLAVPGGEPARRANVFLMNR
jgi:predicted phage terminase large subunit-like protein